MNTSLKKIVQSESIGFYLFAFLIPFNPKWLGLAMVVLFLEAIIRRNFASRQNMRGIFDLKKPYVWLLLFYGLHFIGMLYTTNSSFGWMDIGMKLSFALFPLYVLFFRNSISLERFMQSFIVGALTAIVICYVISMKNYIDSGYISHLRESRLSHFMHRSYWATYLNIALIFVFYLAVKRQVKLFLAITLFFLFLFVIFSTGSKAGILITLVSLLAMLFFWAKTTGRLKYTLILGMLFFSGLLALLFVVPSIQNRLISTIKFVSGEIALDPTSTESTTARILMWETATELIKEQPFLGVGTGDVKDALIARNLEKGYTGVAEMKLNAHNQFLNSWLAIGLLGFLALLASFMIPFIFVTRHSFLFRLILFTLFFSLIPEAFLETQAGIIPTAFLVCLIGIQGYPLEESGRSYVKIGTENL